MMKEISMHDPQEIHDRIASDRALLRRFEPIIHYTKGELFFPMDVEPYIEQCSLWVQKPNHPPVCLVPDGALTPTTLTEVPADSADKEHPFESVYFLRFIEAHDLDTLGVEALKARSITRKKGFHPGRGRLARVGYSSRFIDVLFATTLLARGRVPGDTSVGAYLQYECLMQEHEHYSYYGRVVRQGDWIVLQYWFFYAFNNWRSGFLGVNDHEADWEMISLYLYENRDGIVHPDWIAYASHDFQGDDLRRRWDDPDVEKVGEHPIVYAGAGSHASYFRRGEYMTEITLPFMTPLVRIIDQIRTFWRELLKQYQHEALQSDKQSSFNLFRIPFIDYARGDGVVIGPGQAKTWEPPRLLDPPPDWALHYRGMWGLYTKDPLSGENAPAGPCYNRDGSTRKAWYDPVGWAGLSKVLPPPQKLAHAQARRVETATCQVQLRQKISEKHALLTGLSTEVNAMQGQPHLKDQYQAHKAQIAKLEAELSALRGALNGCETMMHVLDRYIARLEAGYQGPSRSHIQHAHVPVSNVDLRYGRLAEMWASLSMGLIMLIFVGLIIFAPHHVGIGLIILSMAMIFIEAIFRKRLQSLVSGLTNMLAIIGTMVLLFKFSLEISMAVVFLIGSYIMLQNLREILQKAS
jgi:hypothetical protein